MMSWVDKVTQSFFWNSVSAKLFELCCRSCWIQGYLSKASEKVTVHDLSVARVLSTTGVTIYHFTQT